MMGHHEAPHAAAAIPEPSRLADAGSDGSGTWATDDRGGGDGMSELANFDDDGDDYVNDDV